MRGLEAVLRREQLLVAGALAALTALAWLYVWRGAGMGMSALDMTTVALFPHLVEARMPGMSMGGMDAPVIGWATVVAMWWVMMIAMMTPSAAPLVLLYARVMRHRAARDAAADGAPYVPSLALAAGYLAVWLAFSVAATALQSALVEAQLISGTMLWSESAVLSAGVLLLAGAYQLSPLKQACLRHCRAPVAFLTQRWRPGRKGAFVMGVEHGAWCVGCCWMLMALLFVGGVMNLAWIALLAVLVLLEKATPRGVVASRIAGGTLIIWGIATLGV